MKVPNIALLAFAFAFLGCSRNVGPPKAVEITGDDFMKFSVTSFDAKPGQRVTVRLKNVGELPKEAVAHNRVLLAKEAYAPKFFEAGIPHPETDYIAFEQSFYVLAKPRCSGQENRTALRSPHQGTLERTIMSAHFLSITLAA
jgi:azurin